MSDEDEDQEVQASEEAQEAPQEPAQEVAEPEVVVVPPPPVAEAPLTPEQIIAQYEELALQTRLAGQSLFRMTAQHFFGKALSKIDDAFAGLEGWVTPSSKEEKKAEPEPDQKV